jgi:hypothetical protein
MNSLYDVAISFAGEDRKVAESIATGLRDLGYQVFFDQFVSADIWGQDLGDYLSDVYQSKAKYCLVLLSEHYIRKPWTTLERRAAQVRALNEGHEPYLLPVLLDDCQIPTPLVSIAYFDLRKQTVRQLIAEFHRKFQKTDARSTSEHNRPGLVLELTRIRNLKDPNWQGPIPPVASLDVWLRYSGSNQLFIEAIKFYHIETTLMSAASGAFPPSHRYNINYEPGCAVDIDLNPPLVINPSDQEEIHFEVDISPKSVVGGWSCCVLFLAARSNNDLTARLPLFSPLAVDIVTSRVLGRPIVVDLVTLFQYGWYQELMIPRELSPGRHFCTVHPNGAVSVPLVRFGRISEQPQLTDSRDELRAHLHELSAIALDAGELETTAVGAIRLLGSVGDESIQSLLREVEKESSSGLRRRAASEALHYLRKRLELGKDDD